jgi:hypothetical protein
VCIDAAGQICDMSIVKDECFILVECKAYGDIPVDSPIVNILEER